MNRLSSSFSSNLKLLFLSLVLLTWVGCDSPEVTPIPNTQLDTTGGTRIGPNGCPLQYVAVPGNSTFQVSNFCISKYESKNVNGSAESQAAGIPWASVTRDQAKEACEAKGPGFALVDNAHWMTIARDIESVSWNWGGDASISEDGVSRGITNNNSATGFPASTDDNDSCYLATQSNNGPAAVCDLSHYDVARRVHQLTNGELMWDFAGNVSEWISDEYAQNFGVNSWVLNIPAGGFKDQFGPAGNYPAGPTNPTGNIYMLNLGYISSNLAGPSAVIRGGGWNYGRYAGIYTAFFTPTTHSGADTGFRCMYQP